MQSDHHHHHQNQVTSVICRNIKPGYEKDYDNWARRYLTLERKAPGYLGTTIIVPGGSNSSLRCIIRRFADKAAMEAWDNSEESQKLLQEAGNYSTRHYESSTGLEPWFTLPGLKTLSQSPPPRWKMAIVIFFAAYVISSLSRSILNPFLEQWPILGNAIIYTGILVSSSYSSRNPSDYFREGRKTSLYSKDSKSRWCPISPYEQLSEVSVDDTELHGMS